MLRLGSLLFVLQLPSCLSFHSMISTPGRVAFRPSEGLSNSWEPLYMSGSNKRQKRRVRKDTMGAENPSESQPPMGASPPPSPTPLIAQEPLNLKPRDDEVVEFKIQDVRDVISGKSMMDEDEEDEEEEDDDDDEWEYVDVDEEEDTDEYEYVIEDSSGKRVDSLEQLLADAKSFRAAEIEKDKEDKDNNEEEGGISIPKSVSSAISTIVTIDFFVVIALLVWFLAGIFGQYVLKDETIQIAFNNIFEPVVQPALGVLMIGSAAGAMFKKDEEQVF